MKKFYTGALAVIINFLLLSCTKEKLMTYDAQDNVYFNCLVDADVAHGLTGRYVDSLTFSFAFAEPSVTDSVIALPLAVTGAATTTDRNYKIQADPMSTAVAGTHYELPASFVIRAGRTLDTMYVKWKRTAEMKTKPVTLWLQLMPTEQLKTQLLYRSGSAAVQTFTINADDTIRLDRFKMEVSDLLSEGPYWSSYSRFFGTFSEKKVTLLSQIAGMPLNFWSIPFSVSGQDSYALFYGGFMHRYLVDQAANGNPIFEADGITRLRMGYYFP